MFSPPTLPSIFPANCQDKNKMSSSKVSSQRSVFFPPHLYYYSNRRALLSPLHQMQCSGAQLYFPPWGKPEQGTTESSFRIKVWKRAAVEWMRVHVLLCFKWALSVTQFGAIGSWAAARGADSTLEKWTNPTAYARRCCLRHAPLCGTIVSAFVVFFCVWMLSITGAAPGEGKWKSCFFVTAAPPASATLCPWKHNELFKCSTTWYIHFMLSLLHLLPAAAKVSMRGVLGPSLVKDVLSKLLAWNLPWFIKWSTTATPLPLIQMLQTHINVAPTLLRGEAVRKAAEAWNISHFTVILYAITTLSNISKSLFDLKVSLLVNEDIVLRAACRHAARWGPISIKALVVFFSDFAASARHSGWFVSGWVCPSFSLEHRLWSWDTSVGRLWAPLRFQRSDFSPE